MLSRKSGTGVPKYIGYPLVGLGLAALGQMSVVNGRIALLGESAEGVIVSLERTKPTRGASVPVVQFRSGRGEVIVFRGFPQYGSPYEVGQLLRVRYVVGEPTRAEMDSWPTLWRALLIAVGLGVALVSGGAVIVARARHR